MGGYKSKLDFTTLKKEELDLLVANTGFTEQEIKEWHTGFIRDCPDGLLTEEKFKEVTNALFPGRNTDKFCSYTFTAFDQDKSGKIDFYEFLLAIAANHKGDLTDKLARAFDLYDYDKNGVIDQKELAKLISIMYELHGFNEKSSAKNKAKEIIERADLSGDKKLSRTEFINILSADEDLRKILSVACF